MFFKDHVDRFCPKINGLAVLSAAGRGQNRANEDGGGVHCPNRMKNRKGENACSISRHKETTATKEDQPIHTHAYGAPIPGRSSSSSLIAANMPLHSDALLQFHSPNNQTQETLRSKPCYCIVHTVQ